MDDLLAARSPAWLSHLDSCLRTLVPAEEIGLWAMVRYHMGWTDHDGQPATADRGKQLRPQMVLLTAEACSGAAPNATAFAFATAVEMLHNFSLVHDDIEDHSRQRRHRDTVWAIWGEEQAINTGDAMHVLARRAITTASDDPAVVVRASQIFDEASVALCRGQYLDLDFETRLSVTPGEYLDMVSGKTAALFGACLALGGLAGGATDGEQRRLREAGVALGLAFQIQDDILGIWGAPHKIGKSASSDIASRKKTLPVLFGLEQDEALRSLYESSEPLGDAGVATVIDRLDAAGARDYAERIASGERDRGLEELDAALGERGAPLIQLARFLTSRDH